jgi:DNA-binding IclR family transcriptional regulator
MLFFKLFAARGGESKKTRRDESRIARRMGTLNTTSGAARGRPRKHADSQGNKTLLMGLQILRTIAEMEAPDTLTGISKRLGMLPGRAHRYLTALVQADFLELDHASGHYALGLGAVELGAAATRTLDATRLAGEVISGLAERTGLVAQISVWGSNGPTVIREEQGRLETALRTHAGTNLSLLATASGRVFLTYMAFGELGQPLDRDVADWNAGRAKRPKATPAFIERLRAEVRHNEVAFAVGIRNPAVAALAAPVFDRNRRLVMALTLIGLIASFEGAARKRAAQDLKSSALRLSRMLGA